MDDDYVEDILDEMDPYIKEKYESDLAHIFETLEKDDNLSRAVEEICSNTNDMNEIQAKLILVVKGYLMAKSQDKLNEQGKDIEIDEKKITQDITEFCRRLMQDKDQKLESGRMSYKDRAHIISGKAKKHVEKVIKNFVIYEIYKYMNPKKISGETRKMNYQHNLMRGGKKLAEKYAGGSKSDLKRYGASEVARMQRNAAAFRKKGGEWER